MMFTFVSKKKNHCAYRIHHAQNTRATALTFMRTEMHASHVLASEIYKLLATLKFDVALGRRSLEYWVVWHMIAECRTDIKPISRTNIHIEISNGNMEWNS